MLEKRGDKNAEESCHLLKRQICPDFGIIKKLMTIGIKFFN